MRTLSRISGTPMFRFVYRVPNIAVVLVVAGALGALALWRGLPPAAVVAVVLAVLGVAVFVKARRALRRAAGQIETILREELGERHHHHRIGSAAELRVELEGRQGVVDDHRRRADDARLVTRAGSGDAQLRGGRR